MSEAQLHFALAELEREALAQREANKDVMGLHPSADPLGAVVAKLPEELETITEEIIPEEVQAEPEAFERIGEEMTEELDVLPMKVIRRRIVRPKSKRKSQAETVIVTAALPPRVVPGGLPAAGLIAYLLVGKYVVHLPLYRLVKAFAQRFGVKVKRQRMCDWIGYAIENWLMIIYHSIRQGLVA